MMVKCPKCKKLGSFCYFEVADSDGIIGMIVHRTGIFESVTDVLGTTRTIENIERHFLTQSELDATDWFKSWKTDYDEEMKRIDNESLNEMDKLYAEAYWREVKAENTNH